MSTSEIILVVGVILILLFLIYKLTFSGKKKSPQHNYQEEKQKNLAKFNQGSSTSDLSSAFKNLKNTETSLDGLKHKKDKDSSLTDLYHHVQHDTHNNDDYDILDDNHPSENSDEINGNNGTSSNPDDTADAGAVHMSIWCLGLIFIGLFLITTFNMGSMIKLPKFPNPHQHTSEPMNNFHNNQEAHQFTDQDEALIAGNQNANAKDFLKQNNIGNLFNSSYTAPTANDYNNEDKMLTHNSFSVNHNNLVDGSAQSAKLAKGMLREHQGTYHITTVFHDADGHKIMNDPNIYTIKGSTITRFDKADGTHEYYHLKNAYLGKQYGVIATALDNYRSKANNANKYTHLLIIFNKSNNGIEISSDYEGNNIDPQFNAFNSHKDIKMSMVEKQNNSRTSLLTSNAISSSMPTANLTK